MMGDTDRQRSADLDSSSADDNPVTITPNPAFTEEEAAASSAEQQSGSKSTVFAVFSEVLALGRMPKAAHHLLTVTFVLDSLGWAGLAPFVNANFAGYSDRPSALLWLGCAFIGVSSLLFPLVMSSLCLAVAPAAGLEALGINEMELSDESIKSLKKRRLQLFQGGAIPFLGNACIIAALPWLISPERYREICDSIPLGAFGFHLWVNFAVAVTFTARGLMVWHS